MKYLCLVYPPEGFRITPQVTHDFLAVHSAMTQAGAFLGSGQLKPVSSTTTVRVRDGDREIEVSGSAVFVRQVLDDLQNIWARLRGDAPQRPASIRMPEPPAREESLAAIGTDETGS